MKDYRRMGYKYPKGLLGELGELCVLKELAEHCSEIERKGGLCGYDILLQKKQKIEVRTSNLKNNGEYDKSIKFWGWTVEKRGTTRKPKFDFLICVAFKENYKKPDFYIFTKKEAFKNRVINMAHLRNVKRTIHLFPDRDVYRRALRDKKNHNLAKNTGKIINLHREDFSNRWEKIISK